ncbi:Uncharacterised protein [Bordetella pertussis]|nr:Uncharacterised protein [Bordetella pertussis]
MRKIPVVVRVGRSSIWIVPRICVKGGTRVGMPNVANCSTFRPRTRCACPTLDLSDFPTTYRTPLKTLVTCHDS